MADIREQILARLAVVCAAVDGVAAVERNRLDVTGLRRPAILVHDGAEQFLDAPNSDSYGRVQRVELSPEIELLLRSDAAAEIGPQRSLYRTRIVKAVLSDATLRGLTGASGRIRFDGSSAPRPTPESQEPRLQLDFVFTYTLRLSDL